MRKVVVEQTGAKNSGVGERLAVGLLCLLPFFFSSRRRHTRSSSAWPTPPNDAKARRSERTLRASDRAHAHLFEHPRTRGVAVDAAVRLQAARRGRQAICILELS